MPDRPMDAAEGVLAANEAFYRAFGERDFAAMEVLWAAREPIACIHPGGNALRGREAVIASWRSILGSADTPLIESGAASVHVFGDAAFVICDEHLGYASLIATNVFVRERGEWKIVHHQAAPVASDAQLEAATSPGDGGPPLN